MNFVLTVTTFVLLYFVTGVAGAYTFRRLGLISVMQGAVVGTAGYALAIQGTTGALTLGVFLGIAAAAGIGALTVGISERVVGEDYALATFALQMMWSGVISNWTGLTRGALGIPVGRQIPFGSVDPLLMFAATSAIVSIAVLAFAHYQEVSPFSKAAAVVARSSELASTVGLEPLATRVQIGTVAGAIAGVAGVLLSLSVTFVHPSLFDVNVSVLILGISFFALTGSLFRVLFGSAILVLIPELARFAGMAGARSGYLQQLLAGTAVCVGAAWLFRRDR